MTLQLSKEDIIALSTDDDLDGNFIILHNDIPFPVKGEKWHSSDYIEDDGRQYRHCDFKHKDSNKEYSFNYTHYPDDDNSIEYSELIEQGVEIIEQSLYIKPVIKKEIKKSPEKPIDPIHEQLNEEYNVMLKSGVETDIENNLSKEDFLDIKNFLSTESFSLYDLRKKLYPICIKNKFNIDQLWRHIQIKRGVWLKQSNIIV